jgi:hypothetical protein
LLHPSPARGGWPSVARPGGVQNPTITSSLIQRDD